MKLVAVVALLALATLAIPGAAADSPRLVVPCVTLSPPGIGWCQPDPTEILREVCELAGNRCEPPAPRAS